jgi:hypothetical protein
VSAAAEEAVPIVLLGDSRRAALLAQIRTVLDSWCAHWSSTATLRVAFEAPSDVHRKFAESGANSRLRLTRRAATVPALLAFFRGDLTTELLEITPCMTALELAAPITVLAGDMAQAVQAQIGQSFSERVKGLFTDAEVASESRTLRECLDEPGMRRWIHLSVAIGSGRPFAWLLLHPASVAALVPNPSGVSTEALASRRGALGVDAAITLEAVLGDAEVTLVELTALALGDVVVLKQSLSASAQLRTTTGRHVVAAQLGRLGEQRAVTVTSA